MSVTLPTVWGGRGFEVHEVEDAEERPDARLPWIVMVNGVGSWPVAWFYEEEDARLWAETLNAHFASADTLPKGGDAKQAPCASKGSAVPNGETPPCR